VLAATNRVDAIDAALLRPGRFDRIIEIGPPNETERLAILQVHGRGRPLAPAVDFVDLARRTDGFSGADLEKLLREAAMTALRDFLARRQHAGAALEIDAAHVAHAYAAMRERRL
jgi:SpoVK/Ycf46/Vps4 family AAA+-type ATPase